MSFQYLRSAKDHASAPKPVSRTPSTAVAGGIFQLNTDVAAFRHLVDTVDSSNYSPELRDRLDNISQDIMLLVKDTLDKLFDYFGWPYNETTTVPLTIIQVCAALRCFLQRDDEIKGRKLVKDFQSVLEEFQKALQLAAERLSPRNESLPEIVAANIAQIKDSVTDYRSLVDAIGTSKDGPEHRKKLQVIKHHIMALMVDTSPKLRALGKLEHSRGLVAETSVKSKKRVTKVKKVFHRWWKSENPSLKESENSEFVKLSNDFQAVLQEFQKAQLLASRRSSSNQSSSISTDGADPDTMEVEPLVLDKWRESVVSETESSGPELEEWIPGFMEVENQVKQVYEIVATITDVTYLAREQAISIDDIDTTIESSNITTRKVRRASLTTSTGIRLCPNWFWWVLIVLVIIVFIILLIIIL